MYCGVSFLASSNHSYYYNDSSSNRLSAGVIAGIAVGGILSFFLIGTLLIVAVICLRHLYEKQQNHTRNYTQQPIVTATAPPNPLPPSAYNTTQLPTVYYNNSPTDGHAFATTLHQFSQTDEPPPRYTPGPQPQHTPTPQP